MKSPIDTCDPRRIDEFLDSDGYALNDETLMVHLGQCAACREYLESKASSAEDWANAATLLKPVPFDPADAVFPSVELAAERPETSLVIQHVLNELNPSDDPSRLGRLGHYEVTGVIGAGGMGVVLKAVDPSLDRVVRPSFSSFVVVSSWQTS